MKCTGVGYDGCRQQCIFYAEAVSEAGKLSAGSSFDFKGGMVRIKDGKFSNSEHDFDVIFDKYCTITPSGNPVTAVVPFKNLKAAVGKDGVFNFIFVLHEVEGTSDVTTKDGKMRERFNIVVAERTVGGEYLHRLGSFSFILI